jgi:hypothetical protein
VQCRAFQLAGPDPSIFREWLNASSCEDKGSGGRDFPDCHCTAMPRARIAYPGYV